MHGTQPDSEAIDQQPVPAGGAFAREVRVHGPVRAIQKAARGETEDPLIGGLLRWMAVLSPTVRLTRNSIYMGMSVVLVPFVTTALGLLLTEWALDRSTLIRCVVLALAGIYGTAAVVMVYTAALRPTRGRLFTTMRGWSWMDVWLVGTLGLLLPTFAFAAGSAIAIDAGLLAASGPRTHLSARTFELFAWNLLDVVPVLKVPETLNWTPSLKLVTVTGGAIVLAFKLALILPLAQVLSLGLKHAFGESTPSGTRESADT